MVTHRIDDIWGGGGAVNLVVTHTCGHQVAYTYGGKRFAEADVHNYDKVCPDCHNKAELQKLQKLQKGKSSEGNG